MRRREEGWELGKNLGQLPRSGWPSVLAIRVLQDECAAIALAMPFVQPPQLDPTATPATARLRASHTLGERSPALRRSGRKLPRLDRLPL